MTESNSATVLRQYSNWVLWLIWVAATCAGILIVTLLLISASQSQVYLLQVLCLAGAQPGALLLSGAAQHRVMRFFLPGEKSWFRNTLRGVIIGTLLGILLVFVLSLPAQFAIDPNDTRDHMTKGMEATFRWGSVGFLAGLAVSIAAAQRLVLQRHSDHANWWMIAYPLGLALGYIAASKTAFPNELRLTDALSSYLFGEWIILNDADSIGKLPVSLGAMAIITSTITGAALVFILRAGPAMVIQNSKLPAVADVNDASDGT